MGRNSCQILPQHNLPILGVQIKAILSDACILRPREMSSTKPVSRFKQVVEVPKKVGSVNSCIVVFITFFCLSLSPSCYFLLFICPLPHLLPYSAVSSLSPSLLPFSSLPLLCPSPSLPLYRRSEETHALMKDADT